jgi:SAM-dependent methyltransferase
LFAPNDWDGRQDVTEKIKAFYEETPFPNYDEIDDIGVLIQKAEKGIFAHMLDQQIPFNSRVLEAGCGTGQLTNYLGIAQRNVFGADMCLNSLRLANGFRTKNELHRVGFYQMNLFRPVFKPGSFDLVICNGVLHHTSDPLGGFRSLSKLVKKDGYILIGLYNTYGRLATDIRREFFRLTKNRMKSLDSYVVRNDVAAIKRHTWFMDQYKNPHESKHTMGELEQWFESEGFDFMTGIPSPSFEAFDPRSGLFSQHDKGTRLSRFLAQAKLVFTGAAEGGFYIMIGKKR